MVENIVEKGENAGYQHFLLFPQCFRMPFLSGLLKLEIVWKRVNMQIGLNQPIKGMESIVKIAYFYLCVVV